MSVKRKPVGTLMLMLLLVDINNLIAAFGGVKTAPAGTMIPGTILPG